MKYTNIIYTKGNNTVIALRIRVKEVPQKKSCSETNR